MAAGDLNVELQAESKDEIGEITEIFGKMAERVSTLSSIS